MRFRSVRNHFSRSQGDLCRSFPPAKAHISYFGLSPPFRSTPNATFPQTRQFIPKAAMILRPLTHSLVGQSRSLQWTAEMDSAFLQVKKALESASLLVHPRPSASLALPVDASATHVGGVLQQFQDGFWAPLDFFSKKLSHRRTVFDFRPGASRSLPRHPSFQIHARGPRFFNFGRTTSLFVPQFTEFPPHGQPDSRGTSNTLQNLPPAYGTFLVR